MGFLTVGIQTLFKTVLMTMSRFLFDVDEHFSRNQKFVLFHLSEALPRERRSRMASNMYFDPAFSSLAASLGWIRCLLEPLTSLRREPGKSWLGLLHGRHTTGC